MIDWQQYRHIILAILSHIVIQFLKNECLHRVSISAGISEHMEHIIFSLFSNIPIISNCFFINVFIIPSFTSIEYISGLNLTNQSAIFSCANSHAILNAIWFWAEISISDLNWNNNCAISKLPLEQELINASSSFAEI